MIFGEDDEDGEPSALTLPQVGPVILWQLPGLEIVGMNDQSNLSIEPLPRPAKDANPVGTAPRVVLGSGVGGGICRIRLHSICSARECDSRRSLRHRALRPHHFSLPTRSRASRAFTITAWFPSRSTTIRRHPQGHMDFLPACSPTTMPRPIHFCSCSITTWNLHE